MRKKTYLTFVATILAIVFSVATACGQTVPTDANDIWANAPADGAPGSGNRYYVRVSGSDSNNGMNRNQAYRTVAKALTIVNPGDIVYVGAGDYDENLTISRAGTLASLITLHGDTDGSQTGDAGAVRFRGSGRNRPLTINQPYYVLRNITFIHNEPTWAFDNLGGLIWADGPGTGNGSGAHVRLMDCVFDGGYYGWQAYDGNTRFDRCTFRNAKYWGIVHYNGSLHAANCQIVDNGHGVYTYPALSETFSTSPRYNVHLQNTSVLRNSGHGIQCERNTLILNASSVENNGFGNGSYLGTGHWGVYARDCDILPVNTPTLKNNYHGLYLCEDGYNKGAFPNRTLSNWTIGPNTYHGVLVYLTNLTLDNVTVSAGVYPFYSHGFRYWSYSDGSAINPSSPIANVTLKNSTFTHTAEYVWENKDAGGAVTSRHTNGYSVAYHTNLTVENCTFNGANLDDTTQGGLPLNRYGHGLLSYGHKWWNNDGSSNSNWNRETVDRLACTTTVKNSTFKDFAQYGLYAYRTTLNVDGGEFSNNGMTKKDTTSGVYNNRGGWGIYVESGTATTFANSPLIKDNWSGINISGREYYPQTTFDTLSLSNLTLTNNYSYGILTYFLNANLSNVTVTGSAYPVYSHGTRYWGTTDDGSYPIAHKPTVTLSNCTLKSLEQKWYHDINDLTKGYRRYGRVIHNYHCNLTLTNTEITRDTSITYPDTNSTSHIGYGIYHHCGAWWTTDTTDRVAGTLTLNSANIHDLIGHGVESYESEGVVLNGGRIERNGRRENGCWGILCYTKITPSNSPVIADNNHGLYIFGGNSSPQVVYDHPTLDGLILTNNRYHGLLTYYLNLELNNCQITGSAYPFYNHGLRYGRIWTETEDGGGQTTLPTVRLTNCVITAKKWSGNYWSRSSAGVWSELPYEDIGYCVMNYHSHLIANGCDISGGTDKETWHAIINYGHRWWKHSVDPYDVGVGNTVQVTNCQLHHVRNHGLYAYRTGKVTLDGGSVHDIGVKGTHETWAVYMNEVSEFEPKNNPPVTGNMYGVALVGRHYAPQDHYDTINLSNWTIENNERYAMTLQLINSTLSNVTLKDNGYGVMLYGLRYWNYPTGETAPEAEGAKMTFANCTITNNKRTITNTDGSTYDYGWGIYNYHTQLTVQDTAINNNGYYGLLNYGHNWWTPTIYAKVPKAGVTMSNCQVIGNRHHGVHGHLADVTLAGCTITGEGNYGNGVYAYDADLSLGAGNSIQNFHVGASVYASNEWHQRPWGHAHPAIENQTIQNNFGYGIIVQGRSLNINNCTLTNNGVYGIYVHGHPYWTRDSDGDGDQDMPPLMTNATVNVNNTTITGNTNWSMVNYHGNLTLNNTTISAGTGGLGIYSAGHNWWETPPTGKAWNEFAHSYDFVGSTTLNNSQVTALGSHGVHATWQRGLTLNNSKVSGTSNTGVYLHKPMTFDNTPGVLTLNNTEVTGNASYGIYCDHTKIQIDAASAAKLRTNYHGLCINGHQDHLAALKVELADLTISNNTGHGLLIYRANANLQRLTLENNSGQGLYMDGNHTSGQPYVGSLDMTECILRNNGNYGMQVNLGGVANITNSQLLSNDHGAIIYAPGINVDRCDVRANWRWGIQLQPKTGTVATMKNTIIADNANGIWYGPYDNASGDLQLWNCTVASNNDTYGRGYYTAYGLYQANGTATVRNCIFKDSPTYGVYRSAGTTSVAYSLFHGNGTNLVNVTAGDKVYTTNDPKFENLAAGDYHLKISSRAINSGFAATGIVDIDREGRPRPMYDKWELGAYEFPDKTGVRFIESWTEASN